MNWKNSCLILGWIFTILPIVWVGSPAQAGLEWEITKTLEIDGTPIDVALAPDGKNFFVLTDRGRILVYSTRNTLTDQIEVGTQIDQIKVGPREMYCFSAAKKTGRCRLSH